MDYASLFRRALDTLIAHKYLFLMGVLAAFNNSSTWSSGNSGGGSSGGNGADMPSVALPDGFDMPGGFETIIPSMEGLEWLWVLPVVMIVGLIGFAIIVGLILWAIGAIAQGGLIAGVNNAEENEEDSTTFGQAWAAGWTRGWRLIGISLLPLLPILLFVGLSVAILVFSFGITALSEESIGAILGSSFVVMLMCLFCLLTPLWILFDVLRIFALRACMLDETGVFGSYGRGWTVFKTNLGPALVLLIIRFGIAIVLAMILFVPTIIMAVCCLLWPLLLLVNGAITAYFSAVWTLAWREWTGRQGGGPSGDQAVLAQTS